MPTIQRLNRLGLIASRARARRRARLIREAKLFSEKSSQENKIFIDCSAESTKGRGGRDFDRRQVMVSAPNSRLRETANGERRTRTRTRTIAFQTPNSPSLSPVDAEFSRTNKKDDNQNAEHFDWPGVNGKIMGVLAKGSYGSHKHVQQNQNCGRPKKESKNEQNPPKEFRQG